MVPHSASSAPLILVADVAPLLSCGLRHTLAAACTACEVREAATLPELLATGQSPTLVVLATTLPGAPADPVALLHTVREALPQAAIIMLADAPPATSPLVLLRLLRHNVSSLLLRTAPLAELCATVSTVLQCGTCQTTYMLQLLYSHLQRPVPLSEAAGFSARQLEVLHLVAQDLANEDIAEYLCTSVRTVEYHRSQMLQKAGVRTSLGLVFFALRQGLLAADALATTPVGRLLPLMLKTSGSTNARQRQH